MKCAEITDKIIGACFKVHSILGNGLTHHCHLFFKGVRECFAFQEVVYQLAPEIELNQYKIYFCREFEMLVSYDGIHTGTRRVDFLVQDKISAELKAIIRLEAYHPDIGLLINSGAKSPAYKRLTNRKHPVYTSSH